MKIDHMLQREDFYNILENTLNYYYNHVLNQETEVKVVDNVLNRNVVIYPRLNRIIKRIPSTVIIQKTYVAFNVNDNIIKNVLGKAYITFTYLTAGLTQSKALYFSDKSIFEKYHEIIPGNKKIRINNYNTMMADLVVKDTFSREYFINEINYRTNNKFSFVVPIIEYGENWYREPIIEGVNLARITNSTLYKNAINMTLKVLEISYKDSFEYKSSEEYCVDKWTELNILVEKYNKTKEKKISHLMLMKLMNIYNLAVQSDIKIPIVNSHGDLQSGNIYVPTNHEKIYILDWETYNRRSIWYDCATLLLFIRRPNRWSKIIQNRYDPEIKKDLFRMDQMKDYDVTSVLAVLVLEDLIYHLTDILMIPGTKNGEHVIKYIEDIINANW